MRSLLWLCLLLIFSGCGYKGALKLPEPTGQQPAPQQPLKP
jgi:predicted small lipoprotein YifL